jgi:ABC-type multidrug transport system ATPase subunit
MAPDLHLYDEFSALENLTFFARARGLPRERGRDERLLEALGLGARFHDPLATLSTGLRARAKLAFALQPRPRILLLDEPGSNLDAPGRRAVQDAVEGYAGEAAVVVIASNDPGEFALGTRTLELA